MNHSLTRITRITRNAKLGPMPASTSSRSTCPTSCPLRDGGGCYAELGPMSLFWGKVDRGEAGSDFDTFVKQVERLPRRQMWRYGQAGDLPGDGDDIDRDQMLKLARANRGRPVIAYTHKPMTPQNLGVLHEAVTLGFPVNLSANSVAHADALAVHGLNVVVIMPVEYARRPSETISQYRQRIGDLPRHTPEGRRIAICPASYTDTTCLDCGACAGTDVRPAIIGFPAHGTRKRMVSAMASASEDTTPDHRRPNARHRRAPTIVPAHPSVQHRTRMAEAADDLRRTADAMP
ncbi:DUF7227 family protein [Ensifer soli]|uniref:DUF7227 family protein n=1 Tax=Ciceribacter sp. sgz301302 TaxID=3342379 RepID=UPI0035B91532